MRAFGTKLACAAVLIALAGAAAPSPASAKPCGTIELDTITYIFYADSVRCGKAKDWARHIYRSPGHKWEPPGYRCNVLPRAQGGGGCRHKQQTRKVFGWYVPD